MKKSYITPLCEAYDVETQIPIVTSPYSGTENNQLYLRTGDEEEKVTYRVRLGEYAD